jgi:small subunit ribosomal protein S15
MTTAEKRKEIIEDNKINDKDVGSSPVQVALLTTRIKELTEHLQSNRKDHSARRGLMKMVGRRTSLLRHVRKQDVQQYRELIAKLGIRR